MSSSREWAGSRGVLGVCAPGMSVYRNFLKRKDHSPNSQGVNITCFTVGEQEIMNAQRATQS